jgi:putative membrane protein
MATEHDTGVGRIVTLAVVALAALLVLPTFTGGMMWNWGTGIMGGYGGFEGVPGWIAVLGPVMGLVWLVVLAGGAYLAYRAVTNVDDERTGRTDEAMTELRTAYARGDLTDEEYEKRRDVLGRDADR